MVLIKYRNADKPYVAELEISDEMMDYLETQLDSNGKFEPNVSKIDNKDMPWAVAYDLSLCRTIKKIRDKTQNLGDNCLVMDIEQHSTFWVKRKLYEYKYEKTVEKVKDRYVFMRSNKGKLFSVKMNDYLYFQSRPKPCDIVEVTKFLDGKTLVTAITEEYDEEASKAEFEKQMKEFDDLFGGY